MCIRDNQFIIRDEQFVIRDEQLVCVNVNVMLLECEC